ncbi:unnamed protein product [Trifolium pratense]|uniref:Uncharacterized protein n=1 Tax=Trifolium pratense TaxID=57577 RepID=A0ACB0IDD4_TRIPR|nr:unnamed protein product [Trifolium pratense]
MARQHIFLYIYSTNAIDSFNILTTLSRCSFLAVLSLFKQLEQSPQFYHRVVPDIHTWSILIQCHSRQAVELLRHALQIDKR